jgi:hypothetical protein
MTTHDVVVDGRKTHNEPGRLDPPDGVDGAMSISDGHGEPNQQLSLTASKRWHLIGSR